MSIIEPRMIKRTAIPIAMMWIIPDWANASPIANAMIPMMMKNVHIPNPARIPITQDEGMAVLSCLFDQLVFTSAETEIVWDETRVERECTRWKIDQNGKNHPSAKTATKDVDGSSQAIRSSMVVWTSPVSAFSTASWNRPTHQLVFQWPVVQRCTLLHQSPSRLEFDQIRCCKQLLRIGCRTVFQDSRFCWAESGWIQRNGILAFCLLRYSNVSWYHAP